MSLKYNFAQCHPRNQICITCKGKTIQNSLNYLKLSLYRCSHAILLSSNCSSAFSSPLWVGRRTSAYTRWCRSVWDEVTGKKLYSGVIFSFCVMKIKDLTETLYVFLHPFFMRWSHELPPCHFSTQYHTQTRFHIIR